MEDRPEMQLDPDVIVEDKLPEAQNVAFFEVRIWLRGALEHPSNLLDKVNRLNDIPIWMCPVQNALTLVKALKKVHHRHPSIDDPGYMNIQAYFLDANHMRIHHNGKLFEEDCE